jgi:hypothetical protein
MAWTERGTGRYFYRSERVKGCVRRIYLGSGPDAEQAAAQIEQRRQQRAAASATLATERQRHAEALLPLEQFSWLTDLLMHATLISEGFHRHSRGEWRRCRYGRTPHDLPN